MGERFERHRQPWRQDEIQKLHQLAGKGMSVRAIAKALTRSEESVKDRAKVRPAEDRQAAVGSGEAELRQYARRPSPRSRCPQRGRCR